MYSVLARRLISNQTRVPPSETHVSRAQLCLETMMNNVPVITIRMRKQADLTLEEIAKEFNKDTESPLSSDSELEILMGNIALRNKKEFMECGSHYDNSLSDTEKHELMARIRKMIDKAAEKLSLNSFRVVTMMVIEIFA